MSNKVLVILGSGPGLGVATDSLFASKGFDVALLSRNAQRLEQDGATVRKANSDVKVKTYPVDVGDHVALSQVLESVVTDVGAPEVVYFNAANVEPSRIGEVSREYMLENFKAFRAHSIVKSVLLLTCSIRP